MTIKFNLRFIIFLTIFFIKYDAHSQQSIRAVIVVDPSKTYQTIDNFGASDAWSCQFIGNWPDVKKNAIADLLFSRDTLANGNPKGIGLSLWRYNFGAGSANQGASSGIKDEWRRAASFANDSDHGGDGINAQNWFLTAAQQRGVNQFLAFFNSPPVDFTINKKAFASKGQANINNDHYKDFANYAVARINQVKKTTGIAFNYISPVNEPQWDWSDGGQEGCPYSNLEMSKLVKSFNEELLKNRLATRIVLPEAGHIKYLLKNSDKPGKDDQINAFFNSSSPEYIGNLPLVSKSVAFHSYFSTSPAKEAIALRTEVQKNISKINGLKLWQTEYCILGDNGGEINGNKKDLGMDAALYVAKVIHQDLSIANATAWQWWLAITPYNYKDGLVYVDKNKTDGVYHDSKILWVLGNYSRFVEPGMKRIGIKNDNSDLSVSAYKDMKNGRIVMVIINFSATEKPLTIKSQKVSSSKNNILVTYTTDASRNLQKNTTNASNLVVPSKSVVSVIVN